MSLFDEILDDRAEALADVDGTTTAVPSFPASMRARWKVLDDAASVSTLMQTLMAIADGSSGFDDAFSGRLVKLLSQALVQFEVTAGDPANEDAEWVPVLGDDGTPLRFDARMAEKLRERGKNVGKGSVAVALALCGGSGGLMALGMEVVGFQAEATERISAAAKGSSAARRKTPDTAPPSAS